MLKNPRITKFAILGERCSGTNFLEESMITNFDISYTTEHGNKHFFCFNDYTNKFTEDTLFIGIIRNPIYWLNSFSKELHHIPHVNKDLTHFLFNECYSILDKEHIHDPISKFMLPNLNPIEMVNRRDLNYMNGEKYKNIFELRQLKNMYLTRIMPTKVPNYILISYENLLYNFEDTLKTIKEQFCLIQKQSLSPSGAIRSTSVGERVNFGTSVKEFGFIKPTIYKKSNVFHFKQQRNITFNEIIVKTIWQNLDIVQENKLGYFPGDNNEYFKQKNKKNELLLKDYVNTK